jgi:hypothetical protein
VQRDFRRAFIDVIESLASWKETSVDGYSGHLGIEIPLKFVDRLPSLLSERGTAFLLGAGPRMLDGSNRLDVELQARAPSLGLDRKPRIATVAADLVRDLIYRIRT